MSIYPDLNQPIMDALLRGVVIPAHPLALTRDRKLDEKGLQGLTNYYIASGAGGVAVAVHTTQFEIRLPGIDLFEPVLKITAETIANSKAPSDFIKVAGICGPTEQALCEAEIAKKYGYHLGLLSNGALGSYSETELLEHAAAVASIIPIFGFYLQEAAGGRILSYEFWKEFVKLPNVYAIKIAAFNRYQTLDVVRAVCESGRSEEIALYTGNDDNILADLLTAYQFPVEGKILTQRFVGGLLGHWAVWTSRAVELLSQVKSCIQTGGDDVVKLLSTGIQITDMNAALFDAKNKFHGCIPGIHEVLVRQGLMENRMTLSSEETLSNGQADEITRVCSSYPQLTDDAFVRSFLEAYHD